MAMDNIREGTPREGRTIKNLAVRKFLLKEKIPKLIAVILIMCNKEQCTTTTEEKYFFAMSIIVTLLSWIQELYVDIIHLQIMASIGFIISSSLHLTISIIMYNINHRMSKKIPDENDIILHFTIDYKAGNG